MEAAPVCGVTRVRHPPEGKADLDAYQVYDDAAIDALVERYLGGVDREQLDPMLAACVATYVNTLDEDG